MTEAERKIKERWPDAFAWYDDDGTWFIILPHIGEAAVSDDEDVDDAEPRAWADAAKRIEEQR